MYLLCVSSGTHLSPATLGTYQLGGRQKVPGAVWPWGSSLSPPLAYWSQGWGDSEASLSPVSLLPLSKGFSLSVPSASIYARHCSGTEDTSFTITP